MRFLLFALLCFVSVLAAGCEAAFDPFERSDIAFSLFGYFDAAADTQYVRVGTLQESAYDAVPSDAAVMLERLDTGDAVTLRDSVFLFSNGALAHNYWTAAPVEAGTAYRLTAVDSTGARAVATFETPAAFPDPILDAGLHLPPGPPLPPEIQAIRIPGVEKLADLQVRYTLANPDLVVTVSYLDRVRRTPEGIDVVSFGAYADVKRVLGDTACPDLRSAEVFVAAATDEWPDVLDLDLETLALLNTVNNVEGGLGYVGGVMTRRLEWGAMQLVFAFYHAQCQ